MSHALFSPGGLDAFAKGVARGIVTRYPPVVANDPEQTVSRRRIEEILREIFANALQIHGKSRIGFLGRARLKSAFRWELREIGYEEKFVDFAVEKLVEQIKRTALP
jgi:hypothetical protein